MKGIIKFYLSEKSYGFIEGENGEDYFFHKSQTPKGIEFKKGDQVNFIVLETDKGKKAMKVEEE